MEEGYVIRSEINTAIADIIDRGVHANPA